jgi:hypothetical protein
MRAVHTKQSQFWFLGLIPYRHIMLVSNSHARAVMLPLVAQNEVEAFRLSAPLITYHVNNADATDICHAQ